jgi:hypothetical protein
MAYLVAELSVLEVAAAALDKVQQTLTTAVLVVLTVEVVAVAALMQHCHTAATAHRAL